jgi:replicative DNA helicase
MTDAIHPLPHSIEAEQSLLGAMLNLPEACDVVSSLVNEGELFEPVHSDIFRWLLEMRSRSQRPTPELLIAQLGGLGCIDIAGLTLKQYVARLAAAATTILNAPDFAKTIRDLANRRRIIGTAQDATQLAYAAPVGERSEEIITSTIERLDAIISGQVPQTLRAVRIGDAARQALDNLSMAIQNGGAAPGVTWGLLDLDRRTGGLHRGELAIAAGRPGMGKTSFAIHVALSAAAHGNNVLYVSLEMMAEPVAQRALTAIAFRLSGGKRRIAYGDLRTGHGISEADFALLRDAQDHLGALPLVIEQQPSLTIAQITLRARRHQQKKGLGLLIVDHLHKVRVSDRYFGNATAETSELSNACAALPKELNISMLALCQLSRASEGREDKRPKLSDLRQSGSLEQDADVVIFPFRAAYYLLANEPEHGTVEHSRWQRALELARDRLEINIAKQRQGSTGPIEAFCAIECNAFSDAARLEEPEATE